jgi:hypothetical protein
MSSTNIDARLERDTEGDAGSENWQDVLAGLLSQSRKNSPVNFVKLAGELNKEFDRIGGLPRTIVRLLRKSSVPASTKAQLARLSMEIFFRAMEQQPPGLEPSNLTEQQLLAVMSHIHDKLAQLKSAGETPPADTFGE